MFAENDGNYKMKRNTSLVVSGVLLIGSALIVVLFIILSGDHIWSLDGSDNIMQTYVGKGDIYDKLYSKDFKPGQIVLRYWVFGRKYEQPENGYMAYSWKEIWGT